VFDGDTHALSRLKAGGFDPSSGEPSNPAGDDKRYPSGQVSLRGNAGHAPITA